VWLREGRGVMVMGVAGPGIRLVHVFVMALKCYRRADMLILTKALAPAQLVNPVGRAVG